MNLLNLSIEFFFFCQLYFSTLTLNDRENAWNTRWKFQCNPNMLKKNYTAKSICISTMKYFINDQWRKTKKKDTELFIGRWRLYVNRFLISSAISGISPRFDELSDGDRALNCGTSFATSTKTINIWITIEY